MFMIKKYLSLIKFSHTIFAMPFAMIGFVLGVYSVPVLENIWLKLLLVVLCMIFARSAAMAFNRWLDKNFDAANPRTAIREIPAGIISANKALVFVIINCIAFVITTWFINLLCFYLSFVALFVILFYSYTKRFTPLCHLVLGVGLALAPIGAYLAVTGVFSLIPVLFSFVVLCWVSGFDIIYALQDEDFDRSQNLHSIPVWLGKKNALRFSEILHAISALLVIVIGLYAQFNWLYWIGTAIFCGMLIYQHSIVKPKDLSRVNIAFMTANGVASVAFAVFVISDMIVYLWHGL
ncbi:MAG: UbiA family prenyltransferase [Chitinophagaceae bacterium]|nr:UbiA family prenyltransferase [Chitinophagaceae bacterium]